MSGLIDLNSIAARAYTPGAKPSQPAPVKSETSEDNRSKRSALTDRRLAPAFSIELSLAAQKIVHRSGEPTTATVDGSASLRETEPSNSYSQFSEGVGRREAPLGNERRDVAPGSRLNIQI